VMNSVFASFLRVPIACVNLLLHSRIEGRVGFNL